MEEGQSPPVVAMGPATVTRPAEPLRLAANFLFLSAGEFGAKLLAFASFTYLARTLGPVSYGAIEFTLAVMVFFSLPADLGLGAYGAREIARWRIFGSANWWWKCLCTARLPCLWRRWVLQSCVSSGWRDGMSVSPHPSQPPFMPLVACDPTAPG